jgi:hypothetical protein
MNEAVWQEPADLDAVVALDEYARSLTLQQIGSV